TDNCDRLPRCVQVVHEHSQVVSLGAYLSTCIRTQKPIYGAVIVPSARKSALYYHNRVSAVISVILGIVVIVRVVVPIIGIRIEDWKTKRVEEDERSIVETAEAIAKEPMRARHSPLRNARCWLRHRGSRHRW